MKRQWLLAGLVSCAALALSSAEAWAMRDMQSPSADFIKTHRCQARWDYRAAGWLEACVAMGIADYCGTGQSHTLWGTPVVIFDLDHADPGDARVPARGGNEQWVEFNPESPRLYFEAGWRPFNATSKTIGSPVCLSKKRWSTLPLGGPCADRLPDPRVEQKARYCEDLPGISVGALEVNDPAALGLLHDQGALTFNKSAFLDAGLHAWTDGTHLLTSSHGADLGETRPVSDAPAFAPGYRPQRAAGDSLVGVLLSDELRWLVGHLDTVESDEPESALVGLAGFNLRQLITYQLTSGGFITTTHGNALDGLAAVDKFSEGWLFGSRGDALRAITVMGAQFGGTPAQVGKLKRWERCAPRGPARCSPANRDHATSVRAPDAAGGPAWNAVAVEGWVLRAP